MEYLEAEGDRGGGGGGCGNGGDEDNELGQAFVSLGMFLKVCFVFFGNCF